MREETLTNFGVRVVGRFEADLLDTHLAEEDFHEACSR
jgi:hypothetical protein